MEVMIEAPIRKPDVIVRLTPEEAHLLVEFFGSLCHDDVSNPLRREIDDDIDREVVNATYRLTADLYDKLSDLSY